jgi:hypothetical protein
MAKVISVEIRIDVKNIKILEPHAVLMGLSRCPVYLAYNVVMYEHL